MQQTETNKQKKNPDFPLQYKAGQEISTGKMKSVAVLSSQLKKIEFATRHRA